MSAYRQTPTSSGILLFCLFVFLLVTAPRAGIKLGPVPLYFIDVVLIGLVWQCSVIQRLNQVRIIFGASITAWLIFLVIGELAGMYNFKNYIETAYMLVRLCLALSVFFIVYHSINHIRDIEWMLKALTLGVIISSLLMILSSLPGTRSIVSGYVFSNSLLEPAAEQTSRLLADGERGIRGRTLVGVSIIAASFINICWPLVALLARWPWKIGRWRLLAFAACLLAPMAVLMSYSRGPIIGTILIFMAVLVLNSPRIRRGILLPIFAGSLVVLFIGASSQLFYFERLTNRTEIMLNAPLESESEAERLLAYVEPWHHMFEHPRFILFGEGVSIRYSSSAATMPEQVGQATHATFAMGYYAYGLLASLLFLMIFVRATIFVLRENRRREPSAAKLLAPALLISLVGMAPWLIFGHAAISAPRGAMLFFLFLGLIAALAKLRNLQWQPASKGGSLHG